MESGGDELMRWLSAQQAYTESRLAAIPGRERLTRRVRGLSLGTSVVSVGAMAGPYRFYRKIAAGEQLPKLALSGPDGKERVLVDPSLRRGQGGHVSLNNYQPSFDGKLVACNLAEGGAEISKIYVFETATGKELPDCIPRVWGEFGVNWLPDGTRFFYTRMAAEKPGADRLQGMQVFLHTLGQAVSEDIPILGPGTDQPWPVDPKEFPIVSVQPGADWLLAMAAGARPEMRLAVARLSDLKGDKTPWRKVAEYSDGIEGAAILGDDLVRVERDPDIVGAGLGEHILEVGELARGLARCGAVVVDGQLRAVRLEQPQECVEVGAVARVDVERHALPGDDGEFDQVDVVGATW